MNRRRLLFALVPLFLVLAAGEAAGRLLLGDPRWTGFAEEWRNRALTYDPSAPVTVARGAVVGFARGGVDLRPQTWTLPKPAGTFRLVVVGDSTVYGQLPDAFREGLRLGGGDRLEVLNFGMPGAASDRVRILWQAALAQEPDLLLLYTGHNEWLEYGLNPQALTPFAARRVLSALRHGGWGRLLGQVLPTRPPPDLRSRKEQYDLSLQPPLPLVIAAYRANLARICQAGQRAGARFAFLQPTSNLLAPGNLGPGVDPDGSVMATLFQAAADLRAGHTAAAEAAVARVLAERPDTSPALVLDGRLRLARGDRETAMAQLVRARALDPARDRAFEPHSAALQDVAAACGAPYLPTEAPLYDLPDAFDLARPYFLDPVHPSARGYVALAAIVTAQLSAAGLLPADAHFDDRVVLPEQNDPHQRGWHILPDITHPLSPAYDPGAPPPLPGGPTGGTPPRGPPLPPGGPAPGGAPR
ncbi:hypothetical protein L6R53_06210 [Myxococcota bacterium]|nr:hypothetical protein [Myxococcota bacterium]